MTVAQFPNLFMLYGPYTNLGHTSVLFIGECQCNYVVQCVSRMIEDEIKSMEVKQQAMDDWMRWVEQGVADSVFAWQEEDGDGDGDGDGREKERGETWYKSRSGKVVNNWPFSASNYWWSTLTVNFDHYNIEYWP